MPPEIFAGLLNHFNPLLIKEKKMKNILLAAAILFNCPLIYAGDSTDNKQSTKSIFKSADEYFASFAGLVCKGQSLMDEKGNQLLLSMAMPESGNALEGVIKDHRSESKIYDCRGLTDNELLCIVDAGRISVPVYFMFSKNRRSVEADIRSKEEGELQITKYLSAKCTKGN
ncbi:hypothetical protein WAE56_11965 [Iodobacter sp. LRB]|uniref:hypothetical protein n=1 Tax=unclassified Iodobacter TaxID=235634 RepID=UPI000C0DC5BC|nr:hypothetical protein [Iodobacter sp. BJB302]PHV01071.1 hypothetical protein CSQ88_13950 [Iodobacter sp. BJB302]